MSQEAAEAPAADAPPADGHDAVGTHPDAAPPLKSEIELREEAANQLREMVEADEAEQAAAQAAAEGEPQDAPDGEGHPGDQPPAEGDDEPAEGDREPLDTDEEAAAQAKRKEKPSNIREAMRRQRAARRDLEAARKERESFEQERTAFQAEQSEFRSFMESFRADPIGAMSRHLNLPPDQLVAQQADAQANQVPPAIQAQLDAQAKELADYKAAVQKEREEAAEKEQRAHYDNLVRQDVSLLAGIVDNKDEAARYPYYASLSQATRERRALSLLHYTHRTMENPEQFTQHDLWETLDEQAKEDHTSIRSSSWLKRTDADQGQETPAPAAKTPRRRRGGPSARRAAEPAPPRAPQTEDEAREAAAAEARRLWKLDAEERAQRG